MSSCTRCGQGINTTEEKIALNKSWHKYCFKCFNCDQNLDLQRAKIFRGDVFCKSCHTKVTHCSNSVFYRPPHKLPFYTISVTKRESCCKRPRSPYKYCRSSSAISGPSSLVEYKRFRNVQPKPPGNIQLRLAHSCSCLTDCRKRFEIPPLDEIINFYKPYSVEYCVPQRGQLKKMSCADRGRCCSPKRRPKSPLCCSPRRRSPCCLKCSSCPPPECCPNECCMPECNKCCYVQPPPRKCLPPVERCPPSVQSPCLVYNTPPTECQPCCHPNNCCPLKTPPCPPCTMSTPPCCNKGCEILPRCFVASKRNHNPCQGVICCDNASCPPPECVPPKTCCRCKKCCDPCCPPRCDPCCPPRCDPCCPPRCDPCCPPRCDPCCPPKCDPCCQPKCDPCCPPRCDPCCPPRCDPCCPPRCDPCCPPRCDPCCPPRCDPCCPPRCDPCCPPRCDPCCSPCCPPTCDPCCPIKCDPCCPPKCDPCASPKCPSPCCPPNCCDPCCFKKCDPCCDPCCPPKCFDPCCPPRCEPTLTPCCRRCGKKVYLAERVLASGGAFHNSCFSCYCCRKPLDASNVNENEGEIYCKRLRDLLDFMKKDFDTGWSSEPPARRSRSPTRSSKSPTRSSRSPTASSKSPRRGSKSQEKYSKPPKRRCKPLKTKDSDNCNRSPCKKDNASECCQASVSSTDLDDEIELPGDKYDKNDNECQTKDKDVESEDSLSHSIMESLGKMFDDKDDEPNSGTGKNKDDVEAENKYLKSMIENLRKMLNFSDEDLSKIIKGLNKKDDNDSEPLNMEDSNLRNILNDLRTLLSFNSGIPKVKSNEINKNNDKNIKREPDYNNNNDDSVPKVESSETIKNNDKNTEHEPDNNNDDDGVPKVKIDENKNDDKNEEEEVDDCIIVPKYKGPRKKPDISELNKRFNVENYPPLKRIESIHFKEDTIFNRSDSSLRNSHRPRSMQDDGDGNENNKNNNDFDDEILSRASDDDLPILTIADRKNSKIQDTVKNYSAEIVNSDPLDKKDRQLVSTKNSLRTIFHSKLDINGTGIKEILVERATVSEQLISNVNITAKTPKKQSKNRISKKKVSFLKWLNFYQRYESNVKQNISIDSICNNDFKLNQECHFLKPPRKTTNNNSSSLEQELDFDNDPSLLDIMDDLSENCADKTLMCAEYMIKEQYFVGGCHCIVFDTLNKMQNDNLTIHENTHFEIAESEFVIKVISQAESDNTIIDLDNISQEKQIEEIKKVLIQQIESDSEFTDLSSVSDDKLLEAVAMEVVKEVDSDYVVIDLGTNNDGKQIRAITRRSSHSESEVELIDLDDKTDDSKQIESVEEEVIEPIEIDNVATGLGNEQIEVLAEEAFRQLQSEQISINFSHRNNNQQMRVTTKVNTQAEGDFTYIDLGNCSDVQQLEATLNEIPERSVQTKVVKLAESDCTFINRKLRHAINKEIIKQAQSDYKIIELDSKNHTKQTETSTKEANKLPESDCIKRKQRNSVPKEIVKQTHSDCPIINLDNIIDNMQIEALDKEMDVQEENANQDAKKGVYVNGRRLFETSAIKKKQEQGLLQKILKRGTNLMK